MFCKFCGSSIADNSQFCAVCGGRVNAPVVNPTPVYTPPAPVNYVPVPQPAKPKVPGRGFGITSMIMGIAALYYFVVYPYFMLAFLSIDLPYALPGFDSFMLVTFLTTMILYSALPILGIVFSNIAHKRGYINNISRSGRIMSIISLVAFIPALILLIATN